MESDPVFLSLFQIVEYKMNLLKGSFIQITSLPCFYVPRGSNCSDLYEMHFESLTWTCFGFCIYTKINFGSCLFFLLQHYIRHLLTCGSRFDVVLSMWKWLCRDRALPTLSYQFKISVLFHPAVVFLLIQPMNFSEYYKQHFALLQ